MRVYIILRIASQYGGIASSSVIKFAGPTMSTAARYKSGVNATPARVAYPPYEPPRIPTRFGSAIPARRGVFDTPCDVILHLTAPLAITRH